MCELVAVLESSSLDSFMCVIQIHVLNCHADQKAKVNGDGHHMELHGNIEEKEAREAVDVLKEGKGDKEERGKSCGQKRQREREDEDESSYELQGNREIEEERAEGCDGKAEEDDSGVVGPTLGNHGVPITPPKRQTGKERPGKYGHFLECSRCFHKFCNRFYHMIKLLC